MLAGVYRFSTVALCQFPSKVERLVNTRKVRGSSPRCSSNAFYESVLGSSSSVVERLRLYPKSSLVLDTRDILATCQTKHCVAGSIPVMAASHVAHIGRANVDS